MTQRKFLFYNFYVLAHVLARKFELYGKVTSSCNDPILLEGYINGIVTCAYTDIIVNAFISMGTNSYFASKDSPQYYIVKIFQDNLESLNEILKKSSTSFFYDQIEPTIADYFAFEAYSVVHDMHPRLLPANCEALVKLEKIMKERPALANYFNNGRLFKRFTSFPNENEYLTKLAEIK